MQRYSRFSRSSYEDVLPPGSPDEPSLTEITMRALNGHPTPNSRAGGARETKTIEDYPRPKEQDKEWQQPPPPEPSTFWSQDEGAPRSQPTHRASERPQEPTPENPRTDIISSNPKIKQLPRDAQPRIKSKTRDQLAERTAAGARKMLLSATERGGAAIKARFLRDRPAREPDLEAQPGAFSKAVIAFRTKAAPAFVNGAFWLANNLRRREIRKRYNRALVFSHTRIADRKLEQLFFVPTRKAERINPAIDRGIHYDGPVPSKVFDWLMKLMPEDLRQFAFVDIRARRGRTTLLAAKRNFSRIIAYEYDPETFDDLQMNISQFPRSHMVCRNVDCYRGDVDGIRLPDQPCVIYFSGAWREQMLAGAMNYVRETYRQSPRRIYVILENTDESAALAGDNIFDQIEPPLAERLKLRLLSPMDFKVYRSLV
jgi:hypothetical protein